MSRKTSLSEKDDVDTPLPISKKIRHCAEKDDGAHWVELLLREMQTASDIDGARARTSRVLEALEKAIVSRTGGASIAENLQKENVELRQQVEGLSGDNSILKRAVVIQNQRHQEHEEIRHELQRMKQLLAQKREKLSSLRLNNYALTMQLRQAHVTTSIPGHFHPDVF